MNKREYKKPDIEFQNFRLSTDLCAACEIQSNASDNMCPLTVPEFEGITLITELNCDAYAPEITDTLCYHVPIADNNVFGS